MSNLILGEIDITPLLKAKKTLDYGVANAKSDLEKLGTIKYFEHCFEISWRVMKRILAKKGFSVFAPSDTFKFAAECSLIENQSAWNSFIKKRILISYAYDTKLAGELFNFLPAFKKELDNLLKSFHELTLEN